MTFLNLNSLDRTITPKNFTHSLLIRPPKASEIWTFGLESKVQTYLASFMTCYQTIFPTLCSSGHFLPPKFVYLVCVCKTTKNLVMQVFSRYFALRRRWNSSFLVRHTRVPLSGQSLVQPQPHSSPPCLTFHLHEMAVGLKTSRFSHVYLLLFLCLKGSTPFSPPGKLLVLLQRSAQIPPPWHSRRVAGFLLCAPRSQYRFCPSTDRCAVFICLEACLPN